jgi:predicted FMN-binding regulatory protein PaiB
MYIPTQFAESDTAQIAAFVAAHPLATLAGIEDGRPVVDHLPFLCLDHPAPGGTLIAHTAKANPTWRLGEHGAPVVVASRRVLAGRMLLGAAERRCARGDASPLPLHDGVCSHRSPDT